MNKIEHDVQLSKKLSYLLRHGAVKEGLQICPEGFVAVNDILDKVGFHRFTVEDVQRVVAENSKNRFTLKKLNDTLLIKANQGHSLSQVNNLNLKLVENPEYEIIHGTYFSCWGKIKNKGLSRMNRNHIHFSKGLNFTAGLRRSAQIYITVDFSKAWQDGLKFYESENGVILCPGNFNGILERKYFLKVSSSDGRKLFL
ncbi:tRNA 2'-phosphotransferase 1 [Neodiprion fabricii]|uniref:tRNA 2'-phosphotransferase 1 n=1 Tax=Neodiprion fabricii TaxID=2872261 RepID=UPI001ED9664E|nr:tRNA 2'-phosphotransferase 1 [Neodiprion fabricii]XP_046430309.1 tRNA 2'-phosphotransferase 1 [Neodiprion fabricii]XP_046430310.1 tRNA 2'-phosphotransferase 1 [Neodiprion fabricii]